MMRVHLLLPLLFLLGCWADFQENQKHEEEIIEKFDQLRARWSRLHPVTFPPPTAEEKDLLEKYANQKDDTDHIPSIVEINGAGGDRLIEGDIVPSELDVAYLEEKLHEDELAATSSGSSNRSRRAASVISNPNWPKDQPIPFAIRPEYSDEHKEMIRTAIAIIEKNSCINFQENGPGFKLIYVDLGKCNSQIGDLRFDETDQYISLARVGCMYMSTVLHETMHALGFGHTQMRRDRDEYMDVVTSAIKPGQETNFNMLQPHQFYNHSLPYEYNSVMHYPSTDFSIDNETPVLIPKKTDYIGSVGGKHGMTFNDWKVLNIRYTCSENCPLSTQNISCRNSGYQHPRECSRCACPLFYTGQLCEIEVSPKQVLPGKDVKLNFERDAYRANEELNFAKFEKEVHLIKAPEGRLIRITIDRIESHNSQSCLRECVYSAVEIVDEDLTLVGKRFCCNNKTSTTFDSTTNVVGYQVYSMPGWGFISNVTFSLVPTEEPHPEQTTSGTSTTVESSSLQTEEASVATTTIHTDEQTTDEPQTVDPQTTAVTESTSELPLEASTTMTETVEPETTEGSGITDETAEGSGITEETTEGSGTTEEITEGSGITGEATTIYQTERPDTDATIVVDILSSESPELNEDPSTDEIPFVYNMSTTSSIPPTEVTPTRESRIPSPRPTTTETYTTYPAGTEQPITDPSTMQEILDSIKSLLSDIREKIDRLANSIKW